MRDWCWDCSFPILLLDVVHSIIIAIHAFPAGYIQFPLPSCTYIVPSRKFSWSQETNKRKYFVAMDYANQIYFYTAITRYPGRGLGNAPHWLDWRLTNSIETNLQSKPTGYWASAAACVFSETTMIRQWVISQGTWAGGMACTRTGGEEGSRAGCRAGTRAGCSAGYRAGSRACGLADSRARRIAGSRAGFRAGGPAGCRNQSCVPLLTWFPSMKIVGGVGHDVVCESGLNMQQALRLAECDRKQWGVW